MSSATPAAWKSGCWVAVWVWLHLQISYGPGFLHLWNEEISLRCLPAWWSDFACGLSGNLVVALNQCEDNCKRQFRKPNVEMNELFSKLPVPQCISLALKCTPGKDALEKWPQHGVSASLLSSVPSAGHASAWAANQGGTMFARVLFYGGQWSINICGLVT